MSRIIATIEPFLTDFCEDFIVSDTLPGTTHPDDNHDRPWWGLPCTVTPCFGARLVQEGNRLHYLADRAGCLAACDSTLRLRSIPVQSLTEP